MKTYTATKKTADSNTVVEQLNARVLTATFANKTGEQLADLYTYEGTVCRSPKEIVAHGTCAPALGVFVETIQLTF
jgi:NADH:ubiquinone oxidoreductase subunit B-like Fe-S oxidoreductase